MFGGRLHEHSKQYCRRGGGFRAGSRQRFERCVLGVRYPVHEALHVVLGKVVVHLLLGVGPHRHRGRPPRS